MPIELTVRTAVRTEFVDITERIREAAKTARIRDGMVLIFVPHTTAGLTINENADPDVLLDLVKGLERMAPANAGYRHQEGNSDAHLKSSLMGCSLTVPISAGALCLGLWQGIYFCEFDGPRSRTVQIHFYPRQS
jgi:secondary thiamine-phosphate synthase enzyme